MKATIMIFLMSSILALATDIITTEGRTYTNVKVTREEPDGITIMHSGGITKLPFSLLPVDVQKQYGYEPDKELQYQRGIAEKQKAATLMKQIPERDFSGEIAQMLDDGALVYPVSYRSTYSPPPVTSASGMNSMIQASLSAPEVKEYGDPILIVGVPRNLVDGNSWKGKIYECGQFQYTTVQGAPSTVRKYATSRELAYRILHRGNGP